jgi:hypothetical protein
MDYAEGTAILKEFRRQYADTFVRGSATHGIRVAPTDDEPGRVDLLVLPPSADEERRRWEGKSFEFVHGGESLRLPITVVERERYQIPKSHLAAATIDASAPVKPGEFITGFVHGSSGSVGLNLYLDGVLSCISCWHVMCPLTTEPKLGTPVKLRGLPDVAELSGYSRVYFDGRTNVWDFAIARYLDPAMAANQMTACTAGVPPYPTRLAGSLQPGPVYKVGAKTPYCRNGSATGALVSCWLPYDGNDAWFEGQVECTRMSDGGDSGALVIYQASNEMLGMLFGVCTKTSLASPLFQIGWKPQPVVKGLPSYLTS